MENKIKLAQKLQALGFSEKEAMVYINLLELNEGICSSIARKAGIQRSTTYSILDQLAKKGLVSITKENGHTQYRAIDTKIFLEKKRENYKDLEKKITQLESTLPELLSLHKDFVNTPQMEVFKGEEGIIKIMEDSLTSSGEILCWSNAETAFEALEKYYPKYIKQKVEKRIWLRGIFSEGKIAKVFKNNGEKELREVYLIPADEFPFLNEINIYDDKISIISHEDKIGVIIQNAAMAKTQKSIFNFAFKYAKQLSKEIKNKK